jgi:hypothetical protein
VSRELDYRTSKENPALGAARIYGEPLKLGSDIDDSASTAVGHLGNSSTGLPSACVVA